jgi:hypothetical protein
LLSAGTYCVKVTDTGSLPEAATVAVRITTITNPTTPQATSLSDVFASELGVRGFASRTFNMVVAGTQSLTLTGLGGAGPPVVRLSVGAWDGAACRLNTSADVTSGGSITLSADTGAYCVRVSDIGNLTGPVSFIVNVNHS